MWKKNFGPAWPNPITSSKKTNVAARQFRSRKALHNYRVDNTCNGSGEAKFENFLAPLRILMCVCRKNSRQIDIIHTEHKNADPWGEKSNFQPSPAGSNDTKFKKKPKALDYESHFHQLSFNIEWIGSIGVELGITLLGSESTCASAERILEQIVKHTQNIQRTLSSDPA